MRRTARRASPVVLILSLGWTSAPAGQESPASQPTKAEVTFLVIASGKHPLYVDQSAVGTFPKGSYKTLRVESGWHLIWGSKGGEPQWFHFEPGSASTLVLVEPSKGSTQWCLDSNIHARAYIQGEEIKEVAPSSGDLVDLEARIKLASYDKMIKRAGERHEPRFPAEFEAVYRKSVISLASAFKVELPKKLRIDTEAIRYESNNLTIPAAGINMLQLWGTDSGMSWIAVGFNGAQKPDIAYFGVSGRKYNDLFRSIALAWKAATPDSAATGAR